MHSVVGGNGTVKKLTTSLRAFLRYLAVKGRCRAGLADVVPGYAHWPQRRTRSLSSKYRDHRSTSARIIAKASGASGDKNPCGMRFIEASPFAPGLPAPA